MKEEFETYKIPEHKPSKLEKILAPVIITGLKLITYPIIIPYVIAHLYAGYPHKNEEDETYE